MKHVCFFIGWLLLTSCSRSDKETGDQYYLEFTDIIVPYKEGTERILKETQGLLQKQLQSTGQVKLSYEDSVKGRELLKEFELMARSTIDDLNEMKELPGSDLKASGIVYVNNTKAAVMGAYREIVIPLQHTNRRPDQQAIDSLSEEFSNALIDANETFASRQLQFLKDFDLLTID